MADSNQLVPSRIMPVHVPLADMERMAAAMARSGLFGFKTVEQALSLMLVAQAEGLHPARAAQEYHIVDGRPALKADAMLARFQAAGGRVEWTAMTDSRVAGVFSHSAGGKCEIDWDMDRAKRAGLGGKGPWLKYPRQMLRARVISEGVRAVYPGISVGVYTPEEVQDFEPQQATVVSSEPVEPTPAPPARLNSSQAKKAGYGDRINELLDGALHLHALEEAWTEVEAILAKCPPAWEERARDKYEARMETLAKALQAEIDQQRKEAGLVADEGDDFPGDR